MSLCVSSFLSFMFVLVLPLSPNLFRFVFLFKLGGSILILSNFDVSSTHEYHSGFRCCIHRPGNMDVCMYVSIFIFSYINDSILRSTRVYCTPDSSGVYMLYILVHVFSLFDLLPVCVVSSTLEISQIRCHRLGSPRPHLVDKYVPFVFIARCVQLSFRSSTFVEISVLIMQCASNEEGILRHNR